MYILDINNLIVTSENIYSDIWKCMSDINNWEGNLIKNCIHYYVNSDN